MNPNREARDITRPQPGFWMVRLRKGAVEVPCCIRRIHTTIEPGNPLNPMERSPFMAAFVRGRVVDLSEVWERRGRPISEDEYQHQIRVVHWADSRDGSPDETPESRPHEAVDLRTLPAILPPGV